MQAPGLHDLIGRTAIGVGQRIVAKMLVRINSLTAALAAVGLAQKFHVSSDLSLLTTNQVADAAVASICNYGSNPLLSDVFMGFDKSQ
jgi:hypothetical protein